MGLDDSCVPGFVLAAYATNQIAFWAIVAMVASIALVAFLPRDVPVGRYAYCSPHRSAGDVAHDAHGRGGHDPLTRLLTIKEVQARMGLSDSSVRRAIRHRRLAVHRLGRVLRVSEADLQTFLKGCRRAAR